ncbi:MAG: hypothetical protein BAJALOKI1v1_70010 [Promethearchaeota archaeon]|nr:MAG: hypothetical protein BAJALOKI1v1_70010 [Candidatus Lokiarchaeota archaeon]
MPSKKKWVYNPKPIKLSSSEKSELLKKVKSYVDASEKLKEKVNRIHIRGGRIYFYHLYKPFGWDDPNKIFIKPLIDGKYNEMILARITIFNKNWTQCTADWQRHNSNWTTLKEGTLEECLKCIETHPWFESL